jgi:predicted oxidoreductase
MDAAELARCFEDLRASGKVLQFGVSNFSVTQFDLLHRHLPLVTNQIEWSPLHLDPLTDGTLDQAQALGFSPMIWSPFAGGRLFNGSSESAQRVWAVLCMLADAWQTRPETVACAWLLRHPAKVVPVLGSRRLEAYQQAVAALSLSMDRESWYRIWQAGAGHEVA